MSEASDEALISRAGGGDAGAAEMLAVRLGPRIYAHAMRMLGEPAEAEDVTQEALMKLWRIAPGWDPGRARVTTWLYRVTANLCIDRLRRRRTTGLDAAPEVASEAPSAVEAITDRDRAAALQEALAGLSDRQRQAVVLKHLDGLATDEVARIMDISPRAAESLIARGKRALEARLIGRREELGYGGE